MDRARIARERNPDRHDQDRHLQERNKNHFASRDGRSYGGYGKDRPSDRYERSRFDDRDGYGSRPYDGDDMRVERPRENDRRPPPPRERKERSLSPYSKRMALTQAMNMNR